MALNSVYSLDILKYFAINLKILRNRQISFMELKYVLISLYPQFSKKTNIIRLKILENIEDILALLLKIILNVILLQKSVYTSYKEITSFSHLTFFDHVFYWINRVFLIYLYNIRCTILLWRIHVLTKFGKRNKKVKPKSTSKMKCLII